jgi:hypothetical protein
MLLHQSYTPERVAETFNNVALSPKIRVGSLGSAATEALSVFPLPGFIDFPLHNTRLYPRTFTVTLVY